MSFIAPWVLVLALVICIGFSLYYRKVHKQFCGWVFDTWGKRETWWQRLSKWPLMFAAIALAITLGDPRGPEEKVDQKMPSQRTIILIDNSVSMLAEDVRPNRFKKALLLARHFAKNAVGHRLAVMVFSDSHRKLIPFTTDIDLLDSRIDGLSEMRFTSGGTDLPLAIKEVLQYFKVSSEGEVHGNIVLFTDAEQTTGKIKLEVPDSVSVAVVGVGTLRGAKIPLRDQNGNFVRNKTFDGQDVISKLDESFIKSIGDGITNYKYWIATSYSLPTDDILKFFTSAHQDKFDTSTVRAREVYAHIPAILFFVLLVVFVIFNQQRAFAGFVLIASTSTLALSPSERLQLARQNLAGNKLKEAQILYDETPMEWKKTSHEELNLATLGIASGQSINKGLTLYKDVISQVDGATAESLRKNVIKALMREQQNQKQKSEDQKKKQDQQKQNKDQKNQQKQGGNDQDQQQKQNKNQNDPKQDQKNDPKNQKSQDQNKDQQQKQQKQQKQQPKNQQKSKRNQKKRDVPGELKQLLEADRVLQQKLLDTSTRDRDKQNRKDW